MLAVLLGSSLKFDGKFILQTETDGPVDMLVVDFRTAATIRAYARFDADRGRGGRGAAARHCPATLLGRGTLAMTIDQGATPAATRASCRSRARASRRSPTPISASRSRSRPASASPSPRCTCARTAASASWRAGGLLVQFLPDAPERMRQADLPGGDAPEGADGARNRCRGRCLGRGAGAGRHGRGRRADRSRPCRSRRCSTACSTSAACASSRRRRSATNAPARASAIRDDARQLHRRGDRREHRGRRASRSPASSAARSTASTRPSSRASFHRHSFAARAVPHRLAVAEHPEIGEGPGIEVRIEAACDCRIGHGECE